MASKKIYLKRNRPFVHEQINSEEVQDALSYSKRSVGSYYAGKHTTRKGTGLKDDEVKLLLPHILDVSADEHEFRKRVDIFYTDIHTSVPYKGGLELEIGLSNSDESIEDVLAGKSKLSKDNMPISIEDYIKFRHALFCPIVASSPQLAKGNQLMEFFLEDPVEVVDSQLSELNDADLALTDYQMVKKDEAKVEMIVTLMRAWIPKKPGKPAVILSRLSASEKLIVLRELATTHPTKFHEVANDELLRNKYIVDELIAHNLLKRTGSTIMIEETGQAIGESLKEAAAYLFAPKQSQLLNNLKAEYKLKKGGEANKEEVKDEEKVPQQTD